MFLKTLAVAGAIILLVAGPQIVMAKSIKEKLTPQQVTDFCTANGLGEKAAQITLPDGTVITGTIHCESENIAGVVPTDASSALSSEGKDDSSGSSQDDDNQGASHDQSDDHGASASNDHGGSGNGGGDD